MFTASFLMLSLLSLPAKSTTTKVDYKHFTYSSSNCNALPGTLQSVSEKEESEVESNIDIEVLSVLLPFFVSFNATVAVVPSSPQHQSIIGAGTQPLYLLISLFRI